MEKFLTAVSASVIIFITLGVISLLMAFPTKWAVNYVFAPAVLVAVFGGALNVWKAWALNFVATTLIKSQLTESSK